jgi:hypothetical protein
MKKLLCLTIALIIGNISTAQIVEEAFVEQESIPDSIRIFELNDKKGLKNFNTNEILLDAIYSGIYKDDGNYFKIVDQGKYGMYSLKDKNIVISVGYDGIMVDKIYRNSIKEDIFVVENNYKYGLIDKDYKTIFNTEYDYFWNYEYYSYTKKDSLEGAYFFSCDCFKIALKYKNVENPSGARGFIATNDFSADYYTEEGDLLFKNLIQAVQYRSVFDENNRSYLLLVNKENKVGLYDSKLQKFALPQIYEQIYETYYSNIIVKKENLFGIVNEKNETIIDFKYDSIVFFRPFNVTTRFHKLNKKAIDSLMLENLLIGASKNGKFGLINLKGKKIVDFEYDGVDHLDHFYKLKKNGKYLIFNAKGKPITKQVFDDVGLFMPAENCIKASVFNNGKIGYINSYGKIIEPLERESKAKGYKTIEELYQQFVIALKAKDDSVLYEFCEKLIPDEYSTEFMRRIHISYKNFPDRLNKNELTLKSILEDTYQTLLYVKKRLKKRNDLEDIEFVGFEKNQMGYDHLDGYTTLVTEAYGILKSGKKIYEYKLGELINIDGYWKSFTSPCIL